MARKSARGGAKKIVQRDDGRPNSFTVLLMIAVGMGLILIGWVMGSGETHFDDQLAALNVGIVGSVVVLAACALYLLLFRRAVRGRITPLRDDRMSDDRMGAFLG